MTPALLFSLGILCLFLFAGYIFSEQDRKKAGYGTLLSILILLSCISAFFPPKDSIRGGIDITGGSSYIIQIHPSADSETGKLKEISEEASEQIISILRKRLNQFGTKDLIIQKQGKNRLILEMPWVSEEERRNVKESISKSAQLELRLIHSNNSDLERKSLSEKKFVSPPGYTLFKYQFAKDKPSEILFLRNQSIITGSSVRVAEPDPYRKGIVLIQLDSEGGKKMTQATLPLVSGRDRIAILLDNKVISAPVLQTTPLGAHFQITGMNSSKEAEILATSLLNPLENPLSIEEVREISPRLGKAVVRQGIISSIISLSIIFLFMLWYYRFLGIIACITLLCSLTILFGAMAAFQFTLTLPGIAGIILILGIGIDINVLIYERLREELKDNFSHQAFKIAFRKAFSGILDANLTTLIASLILFWKTSENIKGFSVTLILGILATMFSSLLINRTLFIWSEILGFHKNIRFRKAPCRNIYSFFSLRKIFFFLSVFLFLGSIITFGIKRESSLGIDFTGGKILRWQLNKKIIEEGKIKEVLENLNLESSYLVQTEKSAISGNLLSIRCSLMDEEKIVQKIREDFPFLAEKNQNSSYIYPITKQEISPVLGKEFFQKSATSLILVFLAIILYLSLRFQLSFAFGALIALIHDVVVTAGIIAITGTPFSLIHIGAFLTIAGYSINDSIIIFDRAREIERDEKCKSSAEITDKAISYSLSRTMLTSLTTFATTFILWLLGSFDFKNFAFAIMMGVLVGTYSSFFISTPIGVLLRRKEKKSSHS